MNMHPAQAFNGNIYIGGIEMTTVAKRVNSEKGEFFLKELKDMYKSIGYSDEEADEAIAAFKKECEKYQI